MIRYRIVSTMGTTSKLKEYVDLWLKAGWIPQGSPFVYKDQLHQAMVKYEKGKENEVPIQS